MGCGPVSKNITEGAVERSGDLRAEARRWGSQARGQGGDDQSSEAKCQERGRRGGSKVWPPAPK